MSDRDFLIPPQTPPEQTQPALHPKEQKRATIAIWISAIAAVFAVVAAGGTVWQAVEAHRQAEESRAARIEAKQDSENQAKAAKEAAEVQQADVERSRKAAEDSAKAASVLAGASTKYAAASERSAKAAENTSVIANKQFGAAINALVVEYRPVLQISQFGVAETPFNRKPSQMLFLNLMNSGRTPATNVLIAGECHLGTENNPPFSLWGRRDDLIPTLVKNLYLLMAGSHMPDTPFNSFVQSIPDIATGTHADVTIRRPLESVLEVAGDTYAIPRGRYPDIINYCWRIDGTIKYRDGTTNAYEIPFGYYVSKEGRDLVVKQIP